MKIEKLYSVDFPIDLKKLSKEVLSELLSQLSAEWEKRGYLPIQSSERDYEAMRIKLDRLLESAQSLVTELNEYDGIAQTNDEGEYDETTELGLLTQHIEDCRKAFAGWPKSVR